SNAAVQAEDIFKRHRAEPIAIANRFSPGRIENLKRLLAIRRSIGHYFFVRQMRPRSRSTARVANHSSEIADDKNGLVTAILKLPKLAENAGVPAGDGRPGGIGAQFDAQRTAQHEFFAQLGLANDLRGPLF